VVWLVLAPDGSSQCGGTAGLRIGEPPVPPMQGAGAAGGIALDHLRARRFSPGDFARFDLILAMDRKILRDIMALRPEGSDTPVRLMADQDAPDPYYTGDFDGCLDMIDQAARPLVSDMTSWPET